MPRRPASSDPSLAIIARNLKAVRADLGLQQGDVAERAGVNRAMLSRWEKGRQKPEIDALLKLATVYDCSIEDFVAGVNDKYDEITERGIGVNVRRHYQARHAEVKRLALQAMDALTGAVGTVPIGSRPGADRPAALGRSTPTRARRTKKP